MLNSKKENMVHTSIGDGLIDTEGAPVAVARMDVKKSYQGTSALLQKVIRDGDNAAWSEIHAKIDYTYENIDAALTALERETEFIAALRQRLDLGQKLLFKPNLVSVENIDPYTFGAMPGSTGNTEWPFVAAVMRWFHDKAGISYYRMCIGEASTALSSVAALYRHIKTVGRPVTTEAVIEGRSDDFYGGWGFYFVRKYLAECSEGSNGDDPMQGLEESMAGQYLPPGQVSDKLMVYDLNRICDNPSKGREIPVPEGENFESLILHKVIIGGDPADASDRALYPGCVLVNLPRLKVHGQALLTNIIKNLGIGLYPMEVSRTGGCAWEYATPLRKVPGMKGSIPHQVWVPEMDLETCLPRRAPDGSYLVKKTGGLTGTMIDIIAAVAKQGIFMLHIADAIEGINRDHQGQGLGIREPEGLAVAGLDPVAADLFCARYMFSNVGLKEAAEAGIDDGLNGHFPQAVPVPRYNGQAIVTGKGYDCPLRRDFCFQRAEQRGLGKRSYYVVGQDGITGNPLASFKGRLGIVEENRFTEIFTNALYADVYKMPWDLQATFFGYMDAVDSLEGTSRKRDFLKAFDESGDGTVTYEEFGKKGLYGPLNVLAGLAMSTRGDVDDAENFRAFYALLSNILRHSNPKWSADGHDFSREQVYGNVTVVAQMMSQFPKEIPDPFSPGLVWGKGKWPSYRLAADTYIKQLLYGWKYPAKIGLASLYGSAVAFADSRQNGRQLIGRVRGVPDPGAAQKYVEAVRDGRMKPLDFTFFTMPGYGGNLPNVVETNDPAKVLTVVFAGDVRPWPDVRSGDLAPTS